MQPLPALIDGVLELFFPERCVICARDRFSTDWAHGLDGTAPGLHRWHKAHLCAGCHAAWRRESASGWVNGLPLRSPLRESEALVKAVGAWKYRGVRGLVRPFAELLVPLLAGPAAADPVPRLVPVPLHRRRRRERGFDQCRQLAVLAGRAAGLAVAGDVLIRRRATEQQASCAADGDRRARNVSGAFAARDRRCDEPDALILLDDLATTGATLAAAAAALAAGGWRVTCLVALGQAGRLRDRRG